MSQFHFGRTLFSISVELKKLLQAHNKNLYLLHPPQTLVLSNSGIAFSVSLSPLLICPIPSICLLSNLCVCVFGAQLSLGPLKLLGSHILAEGLGQQSSGDGYL